MESKLVDFFMEYKIGKESEYISQYRKIYNIKGKKCDEIGKQTTSNDILDEYLSIGLRIFNQDRIANFFQLRSNKEPIYLELNMSSCSGIEYQENYKKMEGLYESLIEELSPLERPQKIQKPSSLYSAFGKKTKKNKIKSNKYKKNRKSKKNRKNVKTRRK